MPYIFNKYYPTRTLIFCVGEGALIFFIFSLSHVVLLGDLFYSPHLTTYLAKAILVTVICQFFLYLFDLYDFSNDLKFTETATRLTKAFGVALIVLGAVFYFLPQLTTTIIICWRSYFVIYVSLLLWRLAYHYILKKRMFTQNILIIGTGELAADITSVIEEKVDSVTETTI